MLTTRAAPTAAAYAAVDEYLNDGIDLEKLIDTVREAKRTAAALAARCLTVVLPTDALGLVLYQLPLAHDIAHVAPTCRALSDAAKLALKLRPFSSEEVTLAGQDPYGVVSRVRVTLDGHILTLTEESDIRIHVWHGTALKCTIKDRQHCVYWDVAAVPNGGIITAVGSTINGAINTVNDGHIKLHTLDGSLERTIEVGSVVYCVAALPDGLHFVAGIGDGPSDGEVRLYHVDGTLVHKFEGHTGAAVDGGREVYALAVTLDGQRIISGAADCLVKVWDVASKRLLSKCEHTCCLQTVAVMPDGKRILGGGYDGNLRVWLLDGTVENTFGRWHKSVNNIVALPDNQHALSAAEDKVELFNVHDGAVLRTFKHRYTDDLPSVALHPDGLRFVVGSTDGNARILYHGLCLVRK